MIEPQLIVPVRRIPLLAALLSAFAGAGQLYAGWARRAWLAFALDLLVGAATVATWFLAPMPAAATATAAYFIWRILVVVDAWRLARTRPRALARARGWRFGVALALFLVVSLAVGEAAGSVIRASGQTFRIPSAAMAPTVLPGDYLVAVRRGAQRYAIGDLRVYTDSRGDTVFKRIVGVGGDTLEMRAGALLRNGIAVPEPYVEPAALTEDVEAPEFEWQRSALVSTVDAARYRPSYLTWGPLVVPPEHIFTLGDNRGNSLDSRYLGFVADSAILYRIHLVYFSYAADSGVRWGRIGLNKF